MTNQIISSISAGLSNGQCTSFVETPPHVVIFRVEECSVSHCVREVHVSIFPEYMDGYVAVQVVPAVSVEVAHDECSSQHTAEFHVFVPYVNIFEVTSCRFNFRPDASKIKLKLQIHIGKLACFKQ